MTMVYEVAHQPHECNSVCRYSSTVCTFVNLCAAFLICGLEGSGWEVGLCGGVWGNWGFTRGGVAYWLILAQLSGLGRKNSG